MLRYANHIAVLIEKDNKGNIFPYRRKGKRVIECNEQPVEAEICFNID